MKKKITLLLCLTFVFTGCTGKSNHQMEDTTQSESNDEKVRVYYSSVNEKEIGQVYNPLASYSYGLLHYNGNLYTTSYSDTSEIKEDLQMNAILGDEIATISGNHGVFWSTVGDELSETTVEGTLYQVKGYDAQFRVGIYYETTMPSED